MDGVLVVDKSAGVGSTDVVRVVRRAAGQRKVGHTGTLDPEATGVLVVCLGRATRLVRFLQEGAKTYLASAVLGVETTTQDAAGEVTARRSAVGVTEDDLRAALDRFVGRIDQVPPMVSAVKVGGERLYEKARRGEEVEREARTVDVHAMELRAFDPSDAEHPRFDFVVTCGSGTYVRTLAHDVGRVLGVGASLTALRRLANGAFTVDDAIPLDEVEHRGRDGTLGEVVLGLADAVRGMPAVDVDHETAVDVATGRPLDRPLDHDGPVAVIHGGTLLAIYRNDRGRARPEAVFVERRDIEAREEVG